MNACVESVAPETSASTVIPFILPNATIKPVVIETEKLVAAHSSADAPALVTWTTERTSPGKRVGILAKLLAFTKARATRPVPRIVHVQVDAFFASVEQMSNVSLRGQPVVVGSEVVASASHEARLRGVEAGMAIRAARLLCPEGAFLPGTYPRYAEFAERLQSVLETYTPAIETGVLDDFYLDFSGSDSFGADYENVLRGLQADVLQRTGLQISVGVARTKVVAKIASQLQSSDGFRIVQPGCERAFLDSLPVRNLEGLTPAHCAVLAEDGVTTIGQFRRIPKPVVVAAFGEALGKQLWQNARGLDCGAIDAVPGEAATVRELSMDAATADWLELERRVEYLSTRIALSLRNQGKLAQTIGLRVSYTDGYAAHQSIRLTPPTSDERNLFAATEELLAKLCRGPVAFCQMGISATSVPQADTYETLLESELAVAEPAWKLSFFARDRKLGAASRNNLGLANAMNA
jgi:DNA polymerase-4